MATAPRLRMFAGPNGSGKSTLIEVLTPELLGVYLNPDSIEAAIRARGLLDVRAYGVAVDDQLDSHLMNFLGESTLLRDAALSGDVAKLSA